MKNELIKPIIKYTGGKFREYDDFKDYLPDVINNYYEPFFGGGGVWYRLMIDKKINGVSFGNDISKDLILFYYNVQNNKTFIELLKILSYDWEKVKNIGEELFLLLGYLFYGIIIRDKEIGVLPYEEVSKTVDKVLNNKNYNIATNLHGKSLCEFISKEITTKMHKFHKKNIDADTEKLLLARNCIKTATCQAFYFIIREMYNDILLGCDEYSEEERSAFWYFMREMGFGGMFRFSKDGKFNIPYGGLSYNKKCMKCKIDSISSQKVKDMFNQITFSQQDFREFMKQKYEKNDFIFLDPPYDSDFSEYDNNAFGRDDHIALRDILNEIECKWMLVIRKTDFIENLYKDYNKIEFNKTYAFQARGTYDSKKSTHLIIKNF